jgi:hypothetical protein
MLFFIFIAMIILIFCFSYFDRLLWGELGDRKMLVIIFIFIDRLIMGYHFLLLLLIRAKLYCPLFRDFF